MIVTVWVQVIELLHASMAVQVRATILALPQLVVTTSLKRMVTALHVSCALAMPVVFVLVSAGHSRIRSAGQVIIGLTVSRTVIICTQLALLLHASVAIQVRAITLPPLQLVVVASM